jgi:uncharacterized SAM-binding protein YcdF (DUF218 family)
MPRTLSTLLSFLRLLVLGFIFLELGSFTLELAQFGDFAPPSEAEIHRAAAGIVFTGDFARVDEALKLLAARRVPRLYLSGVNGGAGLSREDFVAQFSQRNPELAQIGKLVSCCVEMGEAAENTLQNAFETQCWLERRAIAGPLLLVTGRVHMARALAALSRAAPDHEIVPFPIEDGMSGSEEARSDEYLKFVGTLVLVRIPGVARRSRFSGVFAAGCPREL